MLILEKVRTFASVKRLKKKLVALLRLKSKT